MKICDHKMPQTRLKYQKKIPIKKLNVDLYKGIQPICTVQLHLYKGI